MIRRKRVLTRVSAMSVLASAAVFAVKFPELRWSAVIVAAIGGGVCGLVLRGLLGFFGLMDCIAYFFARRHEAGQSRPAQIFARVLGAEWWRARPDELALPSESAALRLFQIHRISVRSSALARFYRASLGHTLAGLAALLPLFAVCVVW